MNKVQSLLANKHTSAAGIIYVVAKGLAQILTIWFPVHKDKIDSTLQVVEAAAVGYGFLAAGDSSQGQKKVEELREDVKVAVETGDTTLLKKQDSPGNAEVK